MAIKIQKAPGSTALRTKYQEERDAASKLRVGEGFVWETAPRWAHQTVSHWSNDNGTLKVRVVDGVMWVVCVPKK